MKLLNPTEPRIQLEASDFGRDSLTRVQGKLMRKRCVVYVEPWENEKGGRSGGWHCYIEHYEEQGKYKVTSGEYYWLDRKGRQVCREQVWTEAPTLAELSELINASIRAWLGVGLLYGLRRDGDFHLINRGAITRKTLPQHKSGAYTLTPDANYVKYYPWRNAEKTGG